jgi:hypothetical protein
MQETININMHISFEVIRGAGIADRSRIKAHFPVRMQKKDIHIPLLESAAFLIDKLLKDSALPPYIQRSPPYFFESQALSILLQAMSLCNPTNPINSINPMDLSNYELNGEYREN